MKLAAVCFSRCAFWICAATALSAQTFSTLYSFQNASDGRLPYAGLVQATDGNLYGAAITGGIDNFGTVFRITSSGVLTTLHSFPVYAGDGEYPQAALIQANDGRLYGTTSRGGANAGGTIFGITPGGAETTLYSFCSESACGDGEILYGGLVQGADWNFYGTTDGGGTYGWGTIFKITSRGVLTTLYSFCAQSGCPDGQEPYAALVQVNNGDFYGTTPSGGGKDDGTVFKITPGGDLTTLHSFCSQTNCSDGQYPSAPLVRAIDGDLYGATGSGGTHGSGTIFKITHTGTLTTLYNFCAQSGCPDGGGPGGFVQATDGNFYGITAGGGANGNYGTIFKITPSGTLTTLYSFCAQTGCPDGQTPYAGLVQGTDGSFDGTTYSGGAANAGTVFGLSVGLGPFVETLTTTGRVGGIVKILGTDLAGATSVSFNGAAAPFSVISPSLIIATIPAGASTGNLAVVTPRGTLISNVEFRVFPG